MQIVIDVPKDEYEKISSGKFDITGYFKLNLSDAFRNGIPLPKGHGRLVDAKEVYKKFYCRCLARAATEVLNETPTIIEADEEDANDDSTM